MNKKNRRKFIFTTEKSSIFWQNYHNCKRSDCGMYILSPSFTPKASYHASICASPHTCIGMKEALISRQAVLFTKRIILGGILIGSI